MNIVATIVFFIFFFVSVGITSFTLIPVLIILVFGIPFTKRLEQQEVLNKNNGIIKRYLITLLILPTVYLITAFVILLYFPNGVIAYLIGTGVVLFFGFGGVGENESNVKDYFETNEKYLNPVTLEKLYNKSLQQ